MTRRRTRFADRLHALDAARAGALLLGIVLHATMSFFFVIPAQDVSQSAALGVAFYAIHTFRMTLFFVIAGFFGHLLFHRRGARGFVKDRAKRVLVPLTVGWLLLAPPTIAAVLWGLTRTFPDARRRRAAKRPPRRRAFRSSTSGSSTTWRSSTSLALALRAASWRLVDKSEKIRTGVDRWVGRALASHLAPLALAAPTAAVLYFKADWAYWFGIPTPDTGLAPQLPALVAYGTAFALGWMLAPAVDRLDILARQWPVNLGLAVALTATCLSIGGLAPDLAATTAIGGRARAMRLAYTAAYALSIWTWTFGLLGAAVRFGSARERGLRRYVADASYWLYLVHPPIVFGLQVLLMKVPLHWTIKFPAILAVTHGRAARELPLPRAPDGARRAPERPQVPAPRVEMPPIATPTSPLVSALRVAASERVGREATVEPIAELANVTKRYGKTVALDGVSLAVKPGELLAVLGPNGAGKSTAIGLWLGTLAARRRRRRRVLGGSPLEATSRLGVGVMMQEVTLAPMLTTREHVALTASCYRDPLTVEEALALTGTEALADRRYGKLSAGQKRQVQFATAVCGRPRLLFLDEPTVGLDVQAREAMWKRHPPPARTTAARSCSRPTTSRRPRRSPTASSCSPRAG